MGLTRTGYGSARGWSVWQEPGQNNWYWRVWSGGWGKAGAADNEERAHAMTQDALKAVVEQDRRDL